MLTGFSAHICVLFTAADAYMRDFDLYVPEDCTASPEPEHNDIALAYMKMALKVDPTPSTALDLEKLARSEVQKQPAPSNLVSVSGQSQ
jgi:nicotinamidase-related amidase